MIKRGTTAGPAKWIRGPMEDGPDHGSGLSNGYATFSQRSGMGRAGGEWRLERTGKDWREDRWPPTENGWQPFSANLNGQPGKEEGEGRFKGPSLLLPTFSQEERIFPRERVVRLSFSSRQ